MKKNNLENKSEKVIVETKKVEHDFSTLGEEVQIIAVGKQKHMIEGTTYTVGKSTAIILINRGLAILK